MEKDQLRENFERNIKYLQKNIPPDDIYIFSEQTFMAALFFLKKWSEVVNINEELRKDPIAEKWATNIMDLLRYRTDSVDCQLNFGLEDLYENND